MSTTTAQDSKRQDASGAQQPVDAHGTPHQVRRHEVVIVGGGTGGITVAARLTKGLFNRRDVAIIEPSDKHYYQPAWTLVGGGTYDKQATVRSEASVIPRRAKWIQEAVTKFDPEHNRLETADGQIIEYQYLIVAAGIQINWDGVPGLKESIGKGGVCSNYSFDTVSSTWEAIRNFEEGTAIFTAPKGAIKCGGAPQKICYLAEDYFHRNGVRKHCRVVYAAPGAAIFAVAKYRHALERVVSRKGIETMFRHHLVEIKPESKEAVFENVDTSERTILQYDLLHVTPPMSAPKFIADSPLANADGWVDVDKFTLQHVRYRNVFSLGDCSSLPTSKTGAAIRKQAPVLVKNLKAQMAGRPLTEKYNGYTSCPVVTGYGSLILAEFDYDGKPDETFWFDQSRERRAMWWLKKYGLPLLYWHGMLKGRA
jgi:sulfide:quinone oxidoreductase